MLFRRPVITREVKLVSWSTAILWFGWGFGETLIPIFLYQFASGYLEAGLLKSIYEIAALLLLPIAGYFANKVSVKKFLIIAIILYFLVSINYFLAGLMACVWFIVIARVLDGIAWPLACISRESYIFHYTAKSKIARAFGYFDTVSILGWTLSVAASFFLVAHFEIHELLLFIAPASIISLIVVLFLPSRKPKTVRKLKFNFKAYGAMFKELRSWPKRLRTLIISSFLISFVWGSFFFFIPIEVWQADSDLKKIILLAVFYSLPGIFATFIGKGIDVIRANRGLLFSLLGLIIVILLSVTWVGYGWRLIALLLVGIFVEAVSLSRRQLMANFNVEDNFVLAKSRFNVEEMNAVLEEVISLGGFAGIIMVGFLVDFINLEFALSILAFILIFVLVLFFKNKVIDFDK